MCEYCRDIKPNVLLSTEVLEDNIIGWDKNMLATELQYDKLYVKIDTRGYIRLTGEEDNCIDSGEKIAINYCPICGRKIERM